MSFLFCLSLLFLESDRLDTVSDCSFSAPVRFTNIYPNADGSFSVIGHINSKKQIDERKLMVAFDAQGERQFSVDFDDLQQLERLGFEDLGEYRIDAISAVTKYQNDYLMVLKVSDRSGYSFIKTFILEGEAERLRPIFFGDDRKVPMFKSFAILDGHLYGLYTETQSKRFGFSTVWRRLKIGERTPNPLLMSGDQATDEQVLTFDGEKQFRNRGPRQGLDAYFPQSWIVEIGKERFGIRQTELGLYYLDKSHNKKGQSYLKLDGWVEASSSGINKYDISQTKTLTKQQIWYGFSKITGVKQIRKNLLIAYIEPHEEGFSLAMSLVDKEGSLLFDYPRNLNSFFVNASEEFALLVRVDAETGCFTFYRENLNLE